MNRFVRVSLRRLLHCGVLLIASSAAALAAPKNLSYTIDTIQVRGRGDSLEVSMTWRFRNHRVSGSSAVVFECLLQNGDDKCALRPLSVYGSGAARNAYFVKASGRNDEVSIVDAVTAGAITVRSVIPYEQWMDSVRVVVRMCDWTRGGGRRLRAIGEIGRFVRPVMPAKVSLPWEALEVPRSAGERISLWYPVPLVFSEGSRRFDLLLEGNAAAVDSLISRLRPLTSTRRYKPVGSKLVLYGFPGNMSEKQFRDVGTARLNSIYSSLAKKGAFSVYPGKKVFGGVDLEYLDEWLSRSVYASDERIREILSSEESAIWKIDRLKAEKPSVWEELCAERLPWRVVWEAECRQPVMDSPVLARQVMREVPEVLSAAEYMRLASLYEAGSDSWLNYVLAGVEVCPESEELACNAVHSLVDRGALHQASSFMRRVGTGAAGKYALARWLFAMGRYAECVDLLAELAEANSYFSKVYQDAHPFIVWTLNQVDWVRVLSK